MKACGNMAPIEIKSRCNYDLRSLLIVDICCFFYSNSSSMPDAAAMSNPLKTVPGWIDSLVSRSLR
jgi:hypothetical protein